MAPTARKTAEKTARNNFGLRGSCAPIVLFCYQRPQLLEKSLGSLAANGLAPASTLYIYADGPPANTSKKTESPTRVDAVRRLIRQERWQQSFARVHLIEAESNLGLAPSVIRGVSTVLERYDRVIVLEDDVLLSPYFLEFMNQGLELYRDDERVGSVRAHVFDLPEHSNAQNRAASFETPGLFFARMSGDFAWGTWQRVWQQVRFDGRELLRELRRRKLFFCFDYDGCYPYSQMLRDQIAGRNSSWGVRFYASLFLRDMLTLYPGRALAAHIGYEEGTHFSSGAQSPLDGSLYPGRIPVERIEAEESLAVREQMKQLFRQQGFASLHLLRALLKSLLPGRLVQHLRQLRRRARGARP